MKTRLEFDGTSFSIRIPAELADAVGICSEESLDVRAEAGRLIVERSTLPPFPSLKELVDRITPENVHSEISTGRPLGNEIW